ncbi:MAG: enoyl-CoA hydratase [Acidimicrobiales bacterium]
MTARLERHHQGAVALVTIDRPERRNALDLETLRLLTETIGDAVAGGARVLVLTGAGGHFCAGADLGAVEDEDFVGALRRVLQALRDAPLPVLAAVDGAALGAGTQLAVASDLRMATPRARFGIPAARLGLMVDHWTVRRLVALAGEGPARAMLLAAEVLSGEDARSLGFVQRGGDLEAALAWAAEIATLAPLTIQGHKLSLNLVDGPAADPEETAGLAEARRRAWASADLAEGVAAFREKREPRFQGR